MTALSPSILSSSFDWLNAFSLQIRPGMDLSRISFPTFILEPRSFLDKLSDYFYHANYITEAALMKVARSEALVFVMMIEADWGVFFFGTEQARAIPSDHQVVYCGLLQEAQGSQEAIQSPARRNLPLRFRLSTRR